MATKKTEKKSSKKIIRLTARGSKFLPRERQKAGVRVRKNMDMDPTKLAAVKKILGASSETEAIDRAFDEIIFEHKVSAGLDKLSKAGGLPNVDPDA